VKTFRNYIAEHVGVKFIYDNMNICSAPGRKELLNSKFIVAPNQIEDELELLDELFIKYTSLSEITKTNILHLLSQVYDVSLIIKNIQSGFTVDDIQLFEVKKFSVLIQKLKEILCEINYTSLEFSDLSIVINILDPDNTGLMTFYIYDSDDSKLAKLRKERISTNNQNKKDELYIEILKLEDQIRTKLCKELRHYCKDLEINLRNVAKFDVLLAKTQLIEKFNLCRPEIVENRINYCGLFNPFIADILSKKGKKFQAVDIGIDQKPCLITGANMSGKTVLLKTLAVAQIMFQFAFYVPAQKAEIMPVEEIIMSLGDNQDELTGLSSFAAEMLNVDKIIKAAKKGKKILGLVDELARTTNPEEGKAIVNAFVYLMEKYNSSCVVTTHYSGIITRSKRYKVKGLKTDEIKNQEVNSTNINDYIDYLLVEIDENFVPNDALNIIEMLGVEKELVFSARDFISRKL
jgi:DNA mismatch repair ATPase MutS